MQNSINRQQSLREKLKSSMCCFTGQQEGLEKGGGEGVYRKFRMPISPATPSSSSSSSSSASASTWFKLRSASTATAAERVRGRSLKSRMGRKFLQHRQSQSADFSYDPSSYALNFENESPQENDSPFRSFSSRLPPSPPPIHYSDHIVAFS
ncbi:hypothetical protein Fmac_031923 [Flemingia macrophylla]|uniref:Uncharacterized protein n=1 Tax=Flemingia macrophylla TaxID=520843 RepID=A0ABD1L3F6_9FABA